MSLIVILNLAPGKPQAIISKEEAAAKDGHGAEASSSMINDSKSLL